MTKAKWRKPKIIFESEIFTLAQKFSKTTMKPYYTISVRSWQLSPGLKDEVQNHFDPAKNRGSQYGSTWKYRNRKDAEHLLSLALMKWGSIG